MKVLKSGSNVTVVETEDYIVLVSYTTPVAFEMKTNTKKLIGVVHWDTQYCMEEKVMITGKTYTFVKEVRNRTGCRLIDALRAGDKTNWVLSEAVKYIKENNLENDYKKQALPSNIETSLRKCLTVLEHAGRVTHPGFFDLDEKEIVYKEITKLLEEYSDKL